MAKIFNVTSKDGSASAIQVRMDYDKSVGGYAAFFDVGRVENGMFAWFVDADYFRYYQKHQTKLLVQSGRRSAKKEKDAREMFDANAESYVREFVAACAADGAPLEAKGIRAA